MIIAPWSDEYVKMLNEMQGDGRYHPYTCPGDRPECQDQRNLVATNNGWVCQCGKYKQEWSHALPKG